MKERHFRTFWANFVIVVALALTFLAVGVSCFSLPQEDVQTLNTAIYEGDKQSNSVSLMFNVYENGDNAKQIAQLICDYGFSTTFFVGGSWVAKNGDTLLSIASMGIEIGNHGYLHRDHAKLSLESNIKEIRLAERIIDATLGGLPTYANSKLFAPPSGSIGDNMFEACKQLDYKVIMWTRDTIDWRDHDVDLIFERTTSNLQAGDLILMHPTDCTLQALPRILEYIKSVGLKVDTVSNVIKNK